MDYEQNRLKPLIPILGCCSESRINVLQKIQNRAGRIVKNSPDDASTSPVIQNLGWSTIGNPVEKTWIISYIRYANLFFIVWCFPVDRSV